MMISRKFRELKAKDEGAYMPHIYFGDPTEEFSLSQIETLAKNGADLIEFGIPFSDPTADGPTFQAACERALDNGATPGKYLHAIKNLRRRELSLPIIVTTYLNIPYVYGVKKFLSDISAAGAQGIIIPNMPIEEADYLLEAAAGENVDVIFQVAPNTSRDRIKKIVEAASGFLYVMNFEGVTGVRDEVSGSTVGLINRVRKFSDIPLLAGFGISSGKHAESIVRAGVDGAITGSALGKIYERNLEDPEEELSEIGRFASEIKRGCVKGYRNREFSPS